MRRINCRVSGTLALPFSFLLLTCFVAGCAAIFGWNIHAPGILSENFSKTVRPVYERVALYLPPDLLSYQSKNRGSQTADPQTYYIGEALGPMLIEGFQDAFDEFIFLETEPTPPLLKRYGIQRLAVVRIKDFQNHVTLKGQKLTLATETAVFDSDLRLLSKFDSWGVSDSQKVFAKKGGPEVNLNAAIESNILAIIQHLQDWKP